MFSVTLLFDGQKKVLNNADFDSLANIIEGAKKLFNLTDCEIEIKFTDGDERKVLTPERMSEIKQLFKSGIVNCLSVHKKTTSSQSFGGFSSSIQSSTSMEGPTSFQTLKFPSRNSSFSNGQQEYEIFLEICTTDSESPSTLPFILSINSTFTDLMEGIRIYTPNLTPDAVFQIEYTKSGKSITLNEISFRFMFQHFTTIEESMRVIRVTEKKTSRESSKESISSKSINNGSFHSFGHSQKLPFATSIPPANNSSKNNQVQHNQDVTATNATVGSNDLQVLVEEVSSSSTNSGSFGGGAESEKHKLVIKQNDSLSTIHTKLLQKINQPYTLKYFDSFLKSWINVSTDSDLEDMLSSLRSMKPEERRIRAVLSNHKTVNGIFPPSSKGSTIVLNGGVGGAGGVGGVKTVVPQNNSTVEQVITQSLEQKYQQVSVLGKGGFSLVFKVSDNGKTKVVKVILNSEKTYDKRMLNEALNEALQVKSLHHPNIVKIELANINLDPTYLFMVMEYFPNGDMSTIITKGILMAEKEIWRFIKQSALALQHLKGKNVVHRDIKPDNFLQKDGIDGNKIYVLSDFGLAKELDNMGTRSRNHLSGTEYFIAPELKCQGPIPFSPASDMFALGVTLFRLTCHNRSIDLSSIAQTNQDESKLVEEIHKLIKKKTDMYSRRLIELITKMILFNPNDRITPEDVLLVCDNDGGCVKCKKCNKYKNSNCFLNGFTNCSCVGANTCCKDCLEHFLEDTISTMNSTTIIKCKTCSQPYTSSDIRKVVKPATFETYDKIKNPPQKINQQAQPQSPQQSSSTPQRNNLSNSTTKHFGVTCDGCYQSDFSGIRWKCLDCYNYDLCHSCYLKRRQHQNHKFAKLEILDPTYTDDLIFAKLKRDLGQHGVAIKALDDALKKYPLCEEALLLKADSEEKIGNYRNAKVICEKVLNECNGQSDKANTLLGQMYLKQGHPKEALSYLEKSISISEESSLCLYLIGRAHQKLQNYRTALVYARRALAIEKDNTKLSLLAELLVQNEEWQEGKLICNILRLNNPLNAELLYCLGLCEENTGDFTESLKSFNMAISLDSSEIKYQIAANRVLSLLRALLC